MRTVGTYEARNQFSALLELVEQGERVLITRNGKPVAELVQVERDEADKRAKRAAERIKKRRLGRTLGNLSVSDLVSEGRR